MEFIFELVFGRFIIRFLGSNIRFLFVYVFNKNITIEEIRGKDNEQSRSLYNDLMNAMIVLPLLRTNS